MSARSRWPVRAGRACPSEDALFRWSAGDLSRRQADAIAQHVTTCAACAAQLRTWEATLAACRTHDDAAAAPVADDATTVRRFERRLRREPRTTRSAAGLASAWMPAPRVPWLHAAAALILAAACILWLRPAQATLSAETLIARAVDSDQRSPRASASAVTIAQRPAAGGAHAARTTPAAYGSRATAARGRAFVSDRGPDARELERRLAAYWFDWQAPLSAKPFQHWRASASAQGRSDSLEWVDDSLVRVSTSASAGRVRRAEIMLRAPDYRPVAQVWRFADGFEVELRILDRPAPPAAATPALTMAVAVSSESPAVVAAPRSLDETELDLRMALERAGIALDRRVSIRRVADAASGAPAAVSATVSTGANASAITNTAATATPILDASTAAIVIDGRAPARSARRIADAARGLAGVDVRVRASGTPEAPASAAAVASPSAGLQDWLDRTFGASDQRDTFMSRAGELHTRFQDAVAALADLAAHYPSSADARLSPAARRQLRRLTDAYYARVTNSYERLETHLAPLTGTVSRRLLPDDAPAEWRVLPAALDPALRQLSAEIDTIAAGPFDRADAVEAAAHDRLRAALAAVAPR